MPLSGIQYYLKYSLSLSLPLSLSLSHSLSLFTDQDCQFSTCYPLEIVVNFKRPLFLPAEAEVHYYVTEEKGSKVIRLKVTTQKKESLNLEASVVCNASDVSH